MPEHTLEAYRLALDMGADAIETDVVLTRDGELICRHDCELSLTTDVASRPEFARRKSLKCIEGVTAAGWFIEDFTLAEIRTLRSRQRFDFRDRSFDGKFAVATLGELLDLIAARRTKAGRPAGLIVEIKHAAYFDSIGLNMDDAICSALGLFSKTKADGAIWIECFEIDVLTRVGRRISTPLIQLLDAVEMQPADVVAAGGSTTFGDMITPAGLAQIAKYASGIGAWKGLIIPRVPVAGHVGRPDGQSYAEPTPLISNAHAAGLSVHAWTFRSESIFLSMDDENDPSREYQRFANLGLDGIITDFPDTALASLGR